jgi:transcriptional regulator with XRE-family HTH domain
MGFACSDKRMHGTHSHMIDDPHPVDVHVGMRVRLRRTLQGLTQENLAKALGITFQQVQKYERGANRIVASRLFEMARVLNVPVSYFFDDMRGAAAGAVIGGLSDQGQAGFQAEDVLNRDTFELVRAYRAIQDPQVRQKLIELMRSMGKDTPEAN